MDKRPILITGLPRSGTTWIGEVMSSDPDIRYYYEPDNEKVNSYACYFKRDVHRFPFRLEGCEQDDYYLLWKNAFAGMPFKKLNTLLFKFAYKAIVPHIEASIGGKVGFVYTCKGMKDISPGAWKQPFSQARHPFLTATANLFVRRRPHFSNRQILIKSVHSPLCLKWIDINFKPKIVVVLRNPFALYASYKRLFMPDAFRNILVQQDFQSFVKSRLGVCCSPPNGINEEAIFQILLIYKVLANQLHENGHWYFVSHDRLCFNPLEEYQALYAHLGLRLGAKVEEKLDNLNTSGGDFVPKRISRDQPMKWKKELAQKEVDLIEFWMTELGVKKFIENYVYRCDS